MKIMTILIKGRVKLKSVYATNSNLILTILRYVCPKRKRDKLNKTVLVCHSWVISLIAAREMF